MRKFTVIILLATFVAVTARLGFAFAEDTGAKRIGILSDFCMGANSPFRPRLAALGWIEGRNLIIDCLATTRYDQVPLLAAALVARRPDVLVSSPTRYIRALMSATETIPIVMISTPDPVEAGLVTNLPRPERNVTGVAQSGTELVSKRFEMLKEILPHLSRVAVFEFADPVTMGLIEKKAEVAAKTLGFTWQVIPVDRVLDFEGILPA